MTDVLRPRRSVLYMPASNDRALEKAKGLPVDGLILDLEDAVGPDHKEAARENACAAARSGDYGHREVTIRVNGAGTQWHDADLAAACAAGPDAVVVPKVDSADAVARARGGDGAVRRPRAHPPLGDGRDADGRPRRRRHRLGLRPRWPRSSWGPTTSSRSSGCGRSRAACRCSPRCRSPSSRPGGPAWPCSTASGTTCATSRASQEECRQGRDLGFDGKTLVHPGQVEPCNAVFAPSEEEVEQARGVLRAWEGAAGAGVVVHEGRMVELLHVESARKVLATHEAVQARG